MLKRHQTLMPPSGGHSNGGRFERRKSLSDIRGDDALNSARRDTPPPPPTLELNRKNRPSKLLPLPIATAAGSPALGLRNRATRAVGESHSARGSAPNGVHGHTTGSGSFRHLSVSPEVARKPGLQRVVSESFVNSVRSGSSAYARRRALVVHPGSDSTLLALAPPLKDSSGATFRFGHCGTTMRELKMRALEESREARVAKSILQRQPSASADDEVVSAARSPSSSEGTPKEDESLHAQQQSPLASSPSGAGRKTQPVFEGFPSFQDIFDRRHNGLFSPAELARARLAFSRFAPAGASDINQAGVHEALIHLGYLPDLEGMEDVERELAQEVAANTAVAEDGILRLESGLKENACIAPSRAGKLLELSFSEFTDFLEKYEERERLAIRSVFEACCKKCGKNDVIPVAKLAVLLESLGIVTFTTLIEEALRIADLGDRDSLNFADLLALLSALRATEGFSAEQLQAGKDVFDAFAEPLPGFSWESGVARMRMRPSSVKDGLIHFFGLDCAQEANDLTQGLGDGVPAGVGLHEFFIWLRRLDVIDLSVLRERFGEVDTDNDGALSLSELEKLMVKLGFTLFGQAREELLADIGATSEQEFRFDDAARYLKACRSKDGFTRKELDDLSANFEKFDSNNSGEITNLQVMDLLRHLGYRTTLEDVHELAKKVDLNSNGTMDIGEYTRLMRIFREIEIGRAQVAFVNKATGNRSPAASIAALAAVAEGSLRLPLTRLKGAVDSLGYKLRNSSWADRVHDLASDDSDGEASSPERSPRDSRGSRSETAGLPFEEFMEIVDECRATSQRMKRKHAGYHEGELRTIREVFDRFDTKKSESLERGELLWMLADYGLPVQTMEWRSKIFSLMDRAREFALEAGAQKDEVEEMGSSRMRYWPTVQLLRMICRDIEGDAMEREEEARKEANFSPGETSEFRDVYLQHTRKSAMAVAAGQDDTNKIREAAVYLGRPAPGRRGSALPGTDKKKLVGLGAEAWLPLSGIQQLLKSICSELSRADTKLLESKTREIAGPIEDKTRELHGLSEEVAVDFPKFLLLMRWMLDTNFAGINRAADTTVRRMQETRAPKASRGDSRADGTGSEPAAKVDPGRRRSV